MMESNENTPADANVQAEPLDLGLPWVAYCTNPLEPDHHLWNVFSALKGWGKGDVASFWINGPDDELSRDCAKFATTAVNAHAALVDAVQKAADTFGDFEECFRLLGRTHLMRAAQMAKQASLSVLLTAITDPTTIPEAT